MVRVIDTASPPKTTGRFVYVDSETKRSFEHPYLSSLKNMALSHRRANNLPIPVNWDGFFENNVCENTATAECEPDEKSLRGAYHQAKQFAKSMAAWAMSGFDVVDKTVLQTRYDTCHGCEHWGGSYLFGTGRCGKCGCTGLKLYLGTEQCPTDSYDTSLPTLTPGGDPPETRITSASFARNLCQSWVKKDQSRSEGRARVSGLIDGNPPFRESALKAAGRADAINVNFRLAEAYEDAAKSAFYDVFSQAPNYATVTMRERPEIELNRSNVVTMGFHRMLKTNTSWDMTGQGSIQEMVRFGAGPLIFDNGEDWRPVNIQFGYLQVPDGASCDVNKWEVAGIRVDYLAHQLYDFIRDGKAATDVGWNVDQTRNAIMQAFPENQGGFGNTMNWEWHQEQLKTNSYSYSVRSKTIRVFHLFAREFQKKGDAEGKISHAIVLADMVQETDSEQFLFLKIGRYSSWQQCIHPMYYSYGSNGKHYGVTGQGVKMYGAIEAQNRLLCNIYDKVFAPKVMFKPTTASGRQKFLMARMGDYGVLPEGYDSVQVGLNGLIEEGLAFNRELGNLVASNLSQYRQNLQEKNGNPLTATEVQQKASEQARLGKTQLNRFYEQLDWLYAEIYRRATRLDINEGDPGGREALEFQSWCEERGVSRRELADVESVKATRVVGHGSEYMRQNTLQQLLGISGTLPEDGRVKLVQDYIASTAGQELVSRYYPMSTPSTLPDDAVAIATGQVADMKIGVPAVITASQNPITFADVFLKAAGQALQTLGKGGNPDEVVNFLQLVGPAVSAHVQRMAQDPTRQQQAKILGEQLDELSETTDKLVKKLIQQKKQQQASARENQKMQQQAALAQQAMDPKTQLAAAQLKSKLSQDDAKTRQQLKLKRAKTKQDMELKAAKTKQAMAMSDAKTATGMVQKHRQQSQQMRQARQKHEMEMEKQNEQPGESEEEQ
ncbi:MAG: hypothetical protein HW407_1058 [Bacteroidetes bacterium]|nr:hypothetical protein [Bacteroidota bacterium]